LRSGLCRFPAAPLGSSLRLMDKSEWAGRVGEVWAEEQCRTDRTFEPVDEALVATAVAAIEGIAAPRILDIGCGAGTVVMATLKRYPALRGMLFDQPHVLERTADNIRAAGFEGRCENEFRSGARHSARRDA